jgi:hypothetical protein
MRCKPSTFYSNFSLADLVKRNNSRLGLACSSGGMGGVGMGAGSHSGGAKEFRYHKTETFAGHITSASLVESDEAAFIESLKADVQDEIVRRKARVTHASDLKSAGFYLEYSDEGIQGRIEIAGTVSGTTYYNLIATLSETSTSEKQPFVEREIRDRRPTGTYYVFPIISDERHASAHDFLDIGRRAIKESNERVRQRLHADYSHKDFLLKALEYAEVYVWEPKPPEFKQSWAESMGEEFWSPAEFEGYDGVYVLNEVALRMYREAGAEFEILKTISADDVARMLGPSLRGPYFAKDV